MRFFETAPPVSPLLRWGVRVLLLALCGVILAFLIPRLPRELDWLPYDYSLYLAWGQALRHGQITYSYPLPTIFWVFAPLSLLPAPFIFVWAAAPFLFLLAIFGRKGIILWLYFPLLVQTAFAQLDGWLILPLWWLVNNRPLLAPLGAVLLMVKPTLAPLAILVALVRWFVRREWQQLKWFTFILVIFLAPAFVIDPLWLVHFIQQLPVRATEVNVLTRSSSLWAFVWHGGFTLLLLPILFLIILALTLKIIRRRKRAIATAEALNLIFVPFLYLSNSTLLAPLLTSTRELVILTAIAWVAVGLDILAGGFGGVYVLIPVTALWLFANPAPAENALTPPSPTTKTAR